MIINMSSCIAFASHRGSMEQQVSLAFGFTAAKLRLKQHRVSLSAGY